MPGTPRPHDNASSSFGISSGVRKLEHTWTNQQQQQQQQQQPQQQVISNAGFQTRPALNKKQHQQQQSNQFRPHFYPNQIPAFDDKMVCFSILFLNNCFLILF